MVDSFAADRCLTESQFVTYATAQIRGADVILARHLTQGLICSCGRITPCSVAVAVATRRQHFVDRLAKFEMPAATGSARVRLPAADEIRRQVTGTVSQA